MCKPCCGQMRSNCKFTSVVSWWTITLEIAGLTLLYHEFSASYHELLQTCESRVSLNWSVIFSKSTGERISQRPQRTPCTVTPAPSSDSTGAGQLPPAPPPRLPPASRQPRLRPAELTPAHHPVAAGVPAPRLPQSAQWPVARSAKRTRPSIPTVQAFAEAALPQLLRPRRLSALCRSFSGS